MKVVVVCMCGGGGDRGDRGVYVGWTWCVCVVVVVCMCGVGGVFRGQHIQ